MTDLIFSAALEILAGLGILLLGMHFMSEGLQTMAGAGLRKLIATFTSNRFMGIGVGALITAIIQSSSITTVMVVGFINSGFMNLTQAVGVIMGANVGTTMTGWLMTLNIGKSGLLVTGIAAFFFTFSKKEKIKYAALAALGFGLIFMGLEIMKEGIEPISKIPEFIAWFHKFNADTYSGILKNIAVGCILTMIVQSSSVTVGITIALATQGLVTFESAAALVLGENIGSTITAQIASIGSNVNARRAAFFHTFFAIFGVGWVSLIFNVFLFVVEWIAATFFGIPELRASVMRNGVEVFPHLATAIATTHTLFNIINLIALLPFANLLVKFLERFVKEKSQKPQKNVLQYELGDQLLDSPIAAIQQTAFVLRRTTKDLSSMMDDLRTALLEPKSRVSIGKNVFDTEERMDSIEEEITNYLTRLLGQRVPEYIARKAERQLRLVDDLESISDYATQILKLELRLDGNNESFTEEQKDSMMELHDLTASLIPKLRHYLRNEEDGDLFRDISEHGQSVNTMVRELRAANWEKKTQDEYSPLISTTFSDMLFAYRKIKNHIITAAEVHAGLR
ncbi:MAG: Na/Pi cotransporter family protein [Fibrobacter sp.]|nr:Na/Pi cotransporter family protein [Fibrobacter sp.]